MSDPLPAMPSFLERQLPFERSVHVVREGRDAGRRLHVLETGPRVGRPVLMLHGNPTWSFLWRKVMAELASDDLRLIAPDLLGLGLSDKWPRIADHGFDRHVAAITDLVIARELDRPILVGQDWGGPIIAAAGARLAEVGIGVDALVFGNTAVVLPRHPRGSSFHRFARMPLLSDFVFRLLGFPQNGFLGGVQGDRSSIRGEVARAYRWPLRRLADRVAPLALARMVPDGADHPSYAPMKAMQQWVEAFGGPLALVWGKNDPVLGRALSRHRKVLPKAKVWETEAGHFLQEEVPEVLAEAIRWAVMSADSEQAR